MQRACDALFQSPDGDLGFSSISQTDAYDVTATSLRFNPLTGIWVFPPDPEDAVDIVTLISRGFNPLTGIWVFPPRSDLRLPYIDEGDVSIP